MEADVGFDVEPDGDLRPHVPTARPERARRRDGAVTASTIADVDVAVVGGGTGGHRGRGHAAPSRRARRGRSPDPAATPRATVGQSAPPGTDRVVRDVVGAHAFDEAAHLRSLGNRSVWGDADPVLTDFMFNPFGTGWHLDRAAFDARPPRGGGRRRGRRCCTARPSSVRDRGPAAGRSPRRISGSDRRARRCGPRVVCDASGRRAVVARAHGARLVHRDRLVAVVATAPRHPDDDDHTSLVEAVAEGWWYTAPGPDGSARVRVVHRPRPARPRRRHVAGGVRRGAAARPPRGCAPRWRGGRARRRPRGHGAPRPPDRRRVGRGG